MKIKKIKIGIEKIIRKILKVFWKENSPKKFKSEIINRCNRYWNNKWKVDFENQWKFSQKSEKNSRINFESKYFSWIGLECSKNSIIQSKMEIELKPVKIKIF